MAIILSAETATPAFLTLFLYDSEIQEVRREMEAEQRRLVAREAQLCRDKYQAQLEEEERTFQQQVSAQER